MDGYLKVCSDLGNEEQKMRLRKGFSCSLASCIPEPKKTTIFDQSVCVWNKITCV